MNSKIKLALSMLTIVSMVRAYAESSVSMDAAATKSGVKKINCLRVNEQLRVCGDAQVDGVLTVANQIAVSPALAVGTPGVPGLGGDLAYGAAANIGTGTLETVANGDPVPFNITTSNPLVPSAGGVTSNGTSITVANAGVYRIQAQLSGIGATTATDPLTFQLQVNGVAFPAGTFISNSSTGSTINTISGFGLVSLPAGAVLTLVNFSAQTVNLVAEAGVVNAVFTVERVA